MKKLTILFTIALLLMPVMAQAAGFKIKSLTVSSGENPTTSGLTGIIQLTNENGFLEVSVQQEQAWVIYGPKFKLGSVEGIAAGSVGHFQGAPWAGPFISIRVPVAKNVAFSIFHWPAVFPWEPNKWKTENDGIQNPERLFKGYIGSAQLDIGPIGLVYSWQNFLDEPWNKLPGVVYTAKIREDFKISGSATWNNNAEKWMFYIGATWTPK